MERRVLEELYDVVQDRKANPREGSYTCRLFREGKDRILKKVGEESIEVILASKGPDRSRVVCEVSDLIYHTVVLLVEEGISLNDVYEELRRRSGGR